MALYTVDRDLSGWSEDDLNAAAFRAKFCAIWFDDLHWITSYFDPSTQQMLCVWEANRPEDIEAHGRASGLPVDRVVAVQQIDPEHIEAPMFDRSGSGLPDRDAFLRTERASLHAGS